MDEDEFISPHGENDCIEEEITEGDLVNNVLDNLLGPEEEVENDVSPPDDDVAEEHTAPTSKEILRALAIVRRAAEQEEIPDLSFFQGTQWLQRQIRAKAKASAKQSTVDMFFH